MNPDYQMPTQFRGATENLTSKEAHAASDPLSVREHKVTSAAELVASIRPRYLGYLQETAVSLNQSDMQPETAVNTVVTEVDRDNRFLSDVFPEAADDGTGFQGKDAKAEQQPERRSFSFMWPKGGVLDVQKPRDLVRSSPVGVTSVLTDPEVGPRGVQVSAHDAYTAALSDQFELEVSPVVTPELPINVHAELLADQATMAAEALAKIYDIHDKRVADEEAAREAARVSRWHRDLRSAA